MSSFSLSSLSSSGIDVQATVDQLIYAAQAPERLMQAQQQQLQARNSVLSDLAGKMATLKNTVSDLRDLDGTLDSTTAVSSNTAVLTATSSSGAAPGVHHVTVSHLSSTGSWYSDPVAADDTTFASGTLTLKIGSENPVPIQLDATANTLVKAADYINSRALGVTANVLHDSSGARLLLTSNLSGSANDVSVVDNSTGLIMNRGNIGADAELTLDGVPVKSVDNTVSVLPGLTLQLASAAPDSDVQVSVSPDADKITTALQDFVSAYNAVITGINNQFSVSSDGKSVGVLAGDAALRTLQENLLASVAYSPDDKSTFVNLSSLGVTSNDDGTLTVNSAKVADAVKNHREDVQTFFRGMKPQGWAAYFGDNLAKLTSTTDGILEVSMHGIEQEQQALADEISQFDARMDLKRQSLLQQFSKVNALLQQFPMMQAQLTAQLNSLNNK